MIFRRFLISGIFFFSLFSQGLAFEIPVNDGYLTDLANIVSDVEENQIEQKIEAIEQTTTAEIAILTIPTTESNDIATYAFELGNAWGVGKAENSNGIVMIIAVDDRDWFIATGYGVEGALPDAIAKRIGERNFPDNFRNENYTQGILDALEDIEGYLKTDPNVIANYTNDSLKNESDPDNSFLLMILMILAFLLIPIKAIWVRQNKKQKVLRSLLTTGLILGGFWILFHLVVGIIFGIYSLIADWIDTDKTKGSSGHSSRGGWSYDSKSSRGSSFSGGRSSSFGGGSFGGGGARGKW